MDEDASPRPSLRHAAPIRLGLSLFFLVNFGAIVVFHLPVDTPSVDGLPEPVAEALGATLPPVKYATWPLARRYLDATATRQRWTLFAPYPARWTVSLDVAAFYPEETADAGGAGEEAGSPGTDTVTWRADTVRVEGPEEVPYPHLTRHRVHRIVYNMGYEEWGAHYRPLFARRQCRTLRDASGRSPDGVTLTATWRKVVAPWEEDEETETYVQFLGGYTCADLLDEPRPPHLEGLLPPRGPAAGEDHPEGL